MSEAHRFCASPDSSLESNVEEDEELVLAHELVSTFLAKKVATQWKIPKVQGYFAMRNTPLLGPCSRT